MVDRHQNAVVSEQGRGRWAGTPDAAGVEAEKVAVVAGSL